MGSHPDDIAAGARILVGLGYDVVDINLACPVKKIKKKCRGGHLLSVPAEAVAILEAVKAEVGDAVPLTVKLRRAYDDTPAMQDAFDEVLAAAIRLGYAGATVHCRTVQQKYVGPGRWPALKKIGERFGLGRAKAEVRSRNLEVQDAELTSHFTLGGSGDIWTAADIFRMIDATGVDWVSVARGCIGNPWLFTQARALMLGRAALPPTVHQQRDVLLEHFQLSVDLHGEQQASRMMRKFGIKFSRHHPEADAIKSAFIRVRSLDDWRAVLTDYYTHNGPGVDTADALPDEAEAACGEPVA